MMLITDYNNVCTKYVEKSFSAYESMTEVSLQPPPSASIPV